MAAHVIIYATVKDPDKLATYAKGAGPTLAAHGGEFIMAAPVLETLTGQGKFDKYVQIKFPDADAARAWYNSDEYQALIPDRDEGADMLFTLVETDS